jgi:hypothetical protein
MGQWPTPGSSMKRSTESNRPYALWAGSDSGLGAQGSGFKMWGLGSRSRGWGVRGFGG